MLVPRCFNTNSGLQFGALRVQALKMTRLGRRPWDFKQRLPETSRIVFRRRSVDISIVNYSYCSLIVYRETMPWEWECVFIYHLMGLSSKCCYEVIENHVNLLGMSHGLLGVLKGNIISLQWTSQKIQLRIRRENYLGLYHLGGVVPGF